MGMESQGSRVDKSREPETAGEERNSQELCQRGREKTGPWLEGGRGPQRFIHLGLDPSTPASWWEGLGITGRREEAASRA